jgi:soluble lytic murein transglycosylase-like protein
MNKKTILLMAIGGVLIMRLAIKTQYDALINKLAAEHGLDADMIKALIRVESNFNPDAHNTRGEDSRGLGQINAPTAKSLGIIDLNTLFDPEINIKTMCLLINDIKYRYTDASDIIATYNAGRVRLDNQHYINDEYVQKVTAFMWLYKISSVIPI